MISRLAYNRDECSAHNIDNFPQQMRFTCHGHLNLEQIAFAALDQVAASDRGCLAVEFPNEKLKVRCEPLLYLKR